MAFEGLTEKLSAAFKKLRGKGRLTEADVKEAMREIRLALLEADVSYKVVKQFIAQVTEKAVGADVLEALSPAQQIVKIVNQELTGLMGGTSTKLTIASKPPTVVMMVGLQGAGKTTNCAKLAGLMKRKEGKRPLLAACDIYRPAAIQQLEVVGKQLDIPVFQMGQTDPVEIAKAAIAHAREHGNDLVFLDTAGRLHVDEELMDQLNRILNARLGSEIDFIVKGYDNETRSVVGSRREAMLRKRQTFYLDTDEMGEHLIYEGRVVQARVVAVAEKVIRVEVFGVETSIVARGLSWEWIGNARDHFNVGDRILVRVLKINRTDLEHLTIRVDARSVSATNSHDNLKKCLPQCRYAGRVTDVRNGVVFIRLNNGVNAIAHSCYDPRYPGKKDDVSFAVTRIDEEQGVAIGIITRIIKQNL